MRYFFLFALLPAVVGAASAAHHDYQVTVDEQLTALTVMACPAGKPRALAARDRAAAGFLHAAVALPSGRVLDTSSARLPLAAGDRCIEYRVDLAAASRSSNRRYDQIDRANRALSTTLWLWRPQGQGALDLEVSFVLPAGMQVSVPWMKLADNTLGHPRYRIPRSPRSDDAVSVFGNFSTCHLSTVGATLRIAALNGHYPGSPPDLYRWIAQAAHNVSLAYGRFPNPAPQIILIPTATGRGDRGEPVPFGHVIRDGGEAVQFFVNQTQPLDKFIADWTATHEFSHLLIPYINADENWISEGLASYYQNVLMARSGAYTAEKGWRKIIEGFRRGEQAVPHLSLENAMPIGSWDGIMKTYWGGAAIFMLADVELRASSANAVSLDSVLERLQACCLPSSRSWDGRSFFRKLDRLAPTPLFEALYDRYRSAPGFPAYSAALERLGVHLDSARIRFDAAAELAAIRATIMAAPTTATPLTLDCRDSG